MASAPDPSAAFLPLSRYDGSATDCICGRSNKARHRVDHNILEVIGGHADHLRVAPQADAQVFFGQSRIGRTHGTALVHENSNGTIRVDIARREKNSRFEGTKHPKSASNQPSGTE